MDILYKINKLILSIFLINYFNNSCAETIAAHKIKLYAIAQAFTFNDDWSILEGTWQEACLARKLPPVELANATWCINNAGNAVYVQEGDICANGEFVIPAFSGACDKFISECPNSSWTLSIDKNVCTRPDDACWKDLANVSEDKLLAAIAYGESHRLDVYEEMSGIASAVIRRRDAGGFKSVNELIRKKPSFTYVVYNKNERFVKLMCGDKKNYKAAYDAANNALNYGLDYSNGGCCWDGYDLKTRGVNHDKYISGFKYSDPSHDIFKAPEPPHNLIKGRKGLYYDTAYISTNAQGKTIFRKLDETFMKATGSKQCG